MTIIYVTYPGGDGTRFDRDTYVRSHLPLVMASWQRHGLVSVAAFFPAGDGAGTVAICRCVFRDEAAVAAAFASSEAERVMADVATFTDAAPARSRAIPL